MTDVLADEQKEKLNAGIPAGRMGAWTTLPARAYIWPVMKLVYVTGQTLHVNGGMAMI